MLFSVVLYQIQHWFIKILCGSLIACASLSLLYQQMMNLIVSLWLNSYVKPFDGIKGVTPCGCAQACMRTHAHLQGIYK